MSAAIPRPRPRSLRFAVAGLGAVAFAAATSACATTAPSASGASGGTSGKTINVVAAENFWGSIAQQLGGERADVTSVITNPATDPHDYEPTPADGRAVAESQLAIVNGVGYDAWADKLLASNAGVDRTELNVGDLVGVKPGGNPHRWYDPGDVRRVVDRITDDYKRIDPADAAYFDARKNTFEGRTLAPYTKLIADIRAKYAGTPIGASESILTPLVEGLGLTMATPESFLDAISEGSDPTAHDKATIDRQIKDKQIKVYAYNSQNSTPDVQAQVGEAKAQGIPVVAVTETLAPAGSSFQDWQVKQLRDLEQALAEGTGRR